MNHLKCKFGFVYLLILLHASVTLFVAAQESEYPIIVVEYRELQIVPEDLTSLTSIALPFSNEPRVVEILNGNTTYFWESLGPINSDFTENLSLSTYAIVRINKTGFYETLVGLSSNNQSLMWIAPLNTSLSANFSKVILTATDFFANDDIYWGLCEEIVVIPGFLVGLDYRILWRLTFHLVAESERWTILIDISGKLIDTTFVTIPCTNCPYSALAIVVASVTLTLCFVAAVYLRIRRKGIKHSNIQD